MDRFWGLNATGGTAERYEALNVLQAESEVDPFTVERYRQFHRFFPSGAKTVLDIGCNTGRGGIALKQLDPTLVITGLDCVQSRLDALPDGVYRKRLHGSSTAIPSDDNQFDVVVAGEFIEHLYPNDVRQTLGELFRVLRVPGRLLLTTPNPGDIKRRRRGESVLGGAHLSQHHPRELRHGLRMIGFSRVRCYGSGKVSRYLGTRNPSLFIFGSYLVSADKW